MRTLWRKNLKFHRLWQIIAFSLHHKAKAHEFSSILALPPPPPPPTHTHTHTHTQTPFFKKALWRRGRWSFFLQLACKKRSSVMVVVGGYFFCLFNWTMLQENLVIAESSNVLCLLSNSRSSADLTNWWPLWMTLIRDHYLIVLSHFEP